jgi:hypothetical protein
MTRFAVEDLFKAAAGGEVPAEPREPFVQDAGEPSPEAQEEARKLMSRKDYWSTADPYAHDARRRQVQQLLSGVTAPRAPGQARPQAPVRDPAAEARELMRRPEYWDASQPGSETVRAQVKQLMSEAYPEPPAGEGTEGGERTHG